MQFQPLEPEESEQNLFPEAQLPTIQEEINIKGNSNPSQYQTKAAPNQPSSSRSSLSHTSSHYTKQKMPEPDILTETYKEEENNDTSTIRELKKNKEKDLEWEREREKERS